MRTLFKTHPGLQQVQLRQETLGLVQPSKTWDSKHCWKKVIHPFCLSVSSHHGKQPPCLASGSGTTCSVQCTTSSSDFLINSLPTCNAWAALRIYDEITSTKCRCQGVQSRICSKSLGNDPNLPVVSSGRALARCISILKCAQFLEGSEVWEEKKNSKVGNLLI